MHNFNRLNINMKLVESANFNVSSTCVSFSELNKNSKAKYNPSGF